MRMRIIRSAPDVLFALAVSGCGMWQSVKDGTVAATQAVFETKVEQMNLVVTARGALNQDARDVSLPVVLRIYQLKDDKPFATATYAQLLAGTEALKAATLSAATLLATPYAFSYDLAAIAVPVAFLAKDQMHFGLMRGEQAILLGLFCAILALLVIFRDEPGFVTFGMLPIGPVVIASLLGVILRRIFYPRAPVRDLSLPPSLSTGVAQTASRNPSCTYTPHARRLAASSLPS